MDPWPHNQHRHKRTFDEMSSHASTLSPSPSYFGQLGFAPLDISPLDNPPAFYDRRTSHPHNHSSRSNYLSPDTMSDRARPQPRPNLEHRTSQTIIDLTDDADVIELRQERRRTPPRPPPTLERSDRSVLGEVIDLTDDVDEEDDLEITHTRTLPGVPSEPPLRRRHPHPHRHGPPPSIMGILRDDSPIFVPPPRSPYHNHRPPPAFVGIGHIANIMNNLPGWRQHLNDRNLQDGVVAGVMDIMLGGDHPQLMPGVLDYGQHAFAPRPPPPKPEHRPPPKAREGFTRSPTEADVVVCPACEEELVAVPVEDEPGMPKKPNGKPQSKKDREEHPFWVVRECGHVYCNNCYQHRKPDKKSFVANFPEGTSPNSKRRVPFCAVEGCTSEVGDKKCWVGVFI